LRLEFTEDQRAFRATVRDFLDRTLTDAFWRHQRAERLPGWSPEFSRAAASEGLLGIAWPREYGGQERGPVQQTIYMEEMAYAGAPQEHHRRAIQQVGPSIMMFGSDEQKKRFLPGMTTAEISVAMGLSEESAGSDLANVETSALRDGDDFVLNGTKRYTSGAHYSDYLWCVARTDPDAPKHRGISMFIVPMESPGVEVEPLIDLQNRHHFNRVHLTDVRVPASLLVGEENRGWYINAQTMDYERAGGSHIGAIRRLFDAALASVRSSSRPIAPADRHRIAGHAIKVQVARLLAYRIAWQRERGEAPNHEASMVKLITAQVRQEVAQTMVNWSGLESFRSWSNIHDDFESLDLWGPEYLDASSVTVAQGAAEIQRNVIATRGLGLPRA
jgi:3-oxocholest-4-en-26-oyl-CoA dehydrogenase alpha subunit